MSKPKKQWSYILHLLISLSFDLFNTKDLYYDYIPTFLLVRSLLLVFWFFTGSVVLLCWIGGVLGCEVKAAIGYVEENKKEYTFGHGKSMEIV